MPNPFGLLGQGLKKTGGLLGHGLQAAGRNFDRNAVGGIDQAMGEDFTPDMRRTARANAIMSIGQMLATQGRVPISEGLQQGQQRIFGAWKAGRDRKREDESKAMMAEMGKSMLGGGPGGVPQADGTGNTIQAPATAPVASGAAPGGVPATAPQPADPMAQVKAEIANLTRMREQYRQMAGRSAMANNSQGYKMALENYNETTTQLFKYQQMIQQAQPKLHSIDKGIDAATGQPVKLFVMDNGEIRTNPQFALSPDLMLIDRDGVKTLIDKNAQKPGDFTTVENATNQANRMDRFYENLFQHGVTKEKLGFEARRTAVDEANSGTSQFLAQMGALREGREAAKDLRDQNTPKELAGDTAVKLGMAKTVQPQIKRLRTLLQAGGKEMALAISSGAPIEGTELMKAIGEKMVKIYSGANSSPAEIAHYQGQINSWMKSFFNPEQAIRGLDQFETEAQEIHKAIDPRMLRGPVPNYKAPGKNMTDDLVGFKPK